MSHKPFTKPKDFFLGVLIGIYGNWLISFLDRLVFPVEKGTIFWVHYILVTLTFLMFIFYLIFAYSKRRYTNYLLIAHTILPLFVFAFQDYLIKNDPVTLSQNMVFYAVGLTILCLLLAVEVNSSGRYHAYLLKKRWKEPLKIGILNDMGWNVENKEIIACTDIPIEDWKNAFEAFPKIKVELTDVTKTFNKYVTVLNPYGGVYPEADLKNLSTLNKIRNFVKEGGIFVNVADIPSYYAYDLNLKRRFDTTPSSFSIKKNQIIVYRPFIETPLMKELGLTVLNVDAFPQPQDLTPFSESKVNVISKRVAFVESNLKPCIPTNSVLTQLGKKVHTSALFTVRYGEGDFIISLIWISDKPHDKEAKKAIKNTITRITIDKITETSLLRK